MSSRTGNSVLSPQSSVLPGRRAFWTFARRGSLAGYLFVLPVCFVLLLLVAYPFVYAIFISFTDRVVGNAGHWVGFQNFRYLWNFVSFKRALTNTLTLVLVSDGLKLLIGLSLALLLNEKMRLRGMFRSFILLPWAMP
ncbi:MAG: carbohydrate ABC transporter permease, partial [Thermomicrobiales bacterium]